MKKIVLVIMLAGLLIDPGPVRAQLASGHEKFLGCILKGIGEKGMKPDSLFLDYWNQVTPENAGKHGLYEIARDRYKSKAMDEIYIYARSNDLLFKQHTFLFWCCGADPEWLASLTALQIREELEEWMAHYFKTYPETPFVEVVNEPFQSPPPPAVRRALGGDQNYAWVRWMYKKARQHAPPETELWINENMILSGGDRVQKYKALIDTLKADGTIDAIGLQGHWLEKVPADTIRNSLDQIDDLGLPLYITEYDVNEPNDERQKAIWQAQFPILWTHPAVRGVTLWGYKENQIWQKDAFLIRSNGTERPALQWLRGYVKSDK